MRDAALDRLRGTAIALMVLDHLLAWGEVGFCVQATVTRASLPLFMLVSGNLMAERVLPSIGRAAQLAAAACASTWLVAGLPFMAPVDVLVSFCLALLAWPAARLAPACALVVCVVVMGIAPMNSGYSPFELLALMLVGAMTFDVGSWLYRFGCALPWWLAAFGRWPLTWYVGHLAVIRLAVFVTRSW
jgi:hypothetical protein